jgi:predicted O-methyltransferase YrrM
VLKKMAAFSLMYVSAIISSVYLFTVGFIFHRNRLLMAEICSHFGDRTKRIPQVELSTIISMFIKSEAHTKKAEVTLCPDLMGNSSFMMLPGTEDISIQIREPIEKDGNISIIELFVINLLIKSFNPSSMFEMGTFDGRTTLNMACNSSKAAMIWTIDLLRSKINETALPIVPLERQFIDKNTSGSRYLGSGDRKKISQLYGDTATYFSSIDFVFIDASHSYEYVLHDSKTALKLLRDGRGVIVWHDYALWDGVTRAVNELYSRTVEFKNLRHITGTSLACLIKH